MPGGAEANPKRLVVGSRARLASRPGVVAAQSLLESKPLSAGQPRSI